MARIARALFSLAALSAVPLQAGLYDDLYRGLQVFAIPTGSPVTPLGNGFLANGQRSGRVRIVPNRLGDGYRFELDRTFGVDSSGRPEIFDAGNYELELSGAMQATASFTQRGIPTGNLEIRANNLNYAVRGKSGAQDVEFAGTLAAEQTLEVNPLGFYTLNVNVNNTNATLTVDGVAATGDLDTDFDLGPISVKGNIYYDVLLATLTSFGVDTAQLEGLFPKSPIDRINQEISAALAEQAAVLGLQATSTDLVAGSSPALTTKDLFGPPVELSGVAGGRPVALPEPATLALVGLGGLGVLRRLMRRAH